VVTLVGKSWDLHVHEALRTTLDENLAMVADSIAHMTAAGRRATFDAEHFFDGHAADPAYALAVVQAAAEAGADTVVLCDTNGGGLPTTVARVVREVRAALPPGIRVGVHFHDDSACAVANSLVAVEAGARHVQGAANGYGERCGNADLFAIVAGVGVKEGVQLLPPDRPAPLPTQGRAAPRGLRPPGRRLQPRRPRPGRQQGPGAGLGARRPLQRARQGGRARPRSGRRPRPRGPGPGPGQGVGAPRLRLRGRRRLLR